MPKENRSPLAYTKFPAQRPPEMAVELGSWGGGSDMTYCSCDHLWSLHRLMDYKGWRRCDADGCPCVVKTAEKNRDLYPEGRDTCYVQGKLKW